MSGKAEQNHKVRSKKDFGLLAAFIAVAALFLIALAPIVISLVNSGRYKEYVSKLTDGINSSHSVNVVMVSDDSGTYKTPVGSVSKIYNILLGAGMGKEQRKQPEGVPVAVIFEDGSKLEFWSCDIPEPSAERETGLFVKFTTADGYLYQYNTDRLTLSSVTSALN